MSDKLLPADTYQVMVQAVGGDFADGGLLTLRMASALPPEFIQAAVAMGMNVFVPKNLDVLPAGAWWVVGIACSSGMMVHQHRLTESLSSDRFLAALADLVPRVAADIACSLAARIGVAPATLQPDPAERPALLN
ncbi:MAG: hypothetical protein ACK4JB_17400 [Reyranella sp.]